MEPILGTGPSCRTQNPEPTKFDPLFSRTKFFVFWLNSEQKTLNIKSKMDGDIVKSGDDQVADERVQECLSTGKNELNLAALQLEFFPGDVFAVQFIRTLNLNICQIQ